MEQPSAKEYLNELQLEIKRDIVRHEEERVHDDWIADFQNQVDFVPGESSASTMGDTVCLPSLLLLTLHDQVILPFILYCRAGLSKGKRLLDVDSAHQYLALGEEMKTSGNQAFNARDFDMALTR
jgi:hypothetical protein